MTLPQSDRGQGRSIATSARSGARACVFTNVQGRIGQPTPYTHQRRGAPTVVIAIHKGVQLNDGP